MVLDAKDNYDACMKEAEEINGLGGYDTKRVSCLTGYKNDLKKSVP